MSKATVDGWEKMHHTGFELTTLGMVDQQSYNCAGH